MTRVERAAPLSATSLFLVGFPGCSKSSLLQSAVGGFIINTDMSVAVHPDFAAGNGAEMWPFVDASGTAIDGDGKVVTLTWEAIQDVVKRLKAIPRNDPTRPTFIAIDTLDSLIPLIKDSIAKKYKKDSFVDMGQSGWQYLSDEVAGFYEDIRAAGFGAVFTGHLVTEKFTLDGATQSQALRWAFRGITPGINQKLIPRIDNVMLLEARKKTVPVPQPTGPAKMETATDYILDSTNPHRLLSDTLKCKAAPYFPTQLSLPARGTWAKIEAEFATAMAKKFLPLPAPVPAIVVP